MIFCCKPFRTEVLQRALVQTTICNVTITSVKKYTMLSRYFEVGSLWENGMFSNFTRDIPQYHRDRKKRENKCDLRKRVYPMGIEPGVRKVICCFITGVFKVFPYQPEIAGRSGKWIIFYAVSEIWFPGTPCLRYDELYSLP